MGIKREDLAAAAAVGVLQYRQIDPLLIFLLQREVLSQRQKMLKQKSTTRFRATYVLLSYLGTMLALGTAALFAMLFTTHGAGSVGMVTVLWFTLLYVLCAVGMASWFKRRGFGLPVRIFTALGIALVPFAVFAVQHIVGGE